MANTTENGRFARRAALYDRGGPSAVGTGLCPDDAFYTVAADSQAVVLRFGRVIETVEPGLHWKLPLGIDRHYPVQVRRQLKQEFGFGTPGRPIPGKRAKEEQDEEKSMVTGDLNAALVEWVVQYRINDPEQYLFAVRDPDATLRHLSESVMREVVGDRTVDEVITIGRQEIEAKAVQKLQEVTRSYAMGHQDRSGAAQECESAATVQAELSTK